MSNEPAVALVTGAGSGIGRAVCHALLKQDYCVVLAGRRLEPLQETVDLAAVEPERSLCVPTDVGKPEQVKSLFEQCQASFGRLDLLFQNRTVLQIRQWVLGFIRSRKAKYTH